MKKSPPQFPPLHMFSILWQPEGPCSGCLDRYVLVTMATRRSAPWFSGQVCSSYYGNQKVCAVVLQTGMFSILWQPEGLCSGSLDRYVLVTMATRRSAPWFSGQVCSHYYGNQKVCTVVLRTGMFSLLWQPEGPCRRSPDRYVRVTMATRRSVPWFSGQICSHYYGNQKVHAVVLRTGMWVD